ncbi:MAG: hypothetical protein Q8T08_02435, partial [Ignavibacteria bacterium]|nr:hypothetical protein [Ignavibacteria bacterium]
MPRNEIDLQQKMKHLLLYNLRNQAFRVFSILLVFVFVFSFKTNAQIKKTGLPLINNFPKSIYKASTQNWAIVQNSLGYIYFANNDGLLEFDGQHWTIYPVPNKSIVRSVLAVGDTIFVGAFEEFGFFAPNTEGKLTYHSLVNLVTEADRAFDEIWKIHKTSEGVLFQSFKFLFLHTNNNIKTFKPNSSFGHSYIVGEEVYIIDTKDGLQKFWDGQLKVVSNDPLFINNEIRCILPYLNGQLLIGFINKGVFVFDGNTLKPWVTSV